MRYTDNPQSDGKRHVYLGVAGWNIRREHSQCFEPSGTHLQRYAGTFNAVEINSCFYRPHRVTTYERWAASVPDHFRFAVKLPKAITHEARFVNASDLLAKFVGEIAGLGAKLGPILVQLPPSFAFDSALVLPFLEELRLRVGGQIVLEPRHESWFHEDVEGELARLRIGRVAADPAKVEAAALPGGFPDLIYYRLHGSPRIYYSAYEKPYLERVAVALAEHAEAGKSVWCIFDNTALGFATADALTVQQLLRSHGYV